MLLRGFSRMRIIRLVALLRTHNKRYEGLPGGWWLFLTSREMAILTSWREKTGLPITVCLRRAVETLDRYIRSGVLDLEVLR